MSSTGRKQDQIWDLFEKKRIAGKNYNIAKCRKCTKEMAGIVDRLRKHAEECKDAGDADVAIISDGAGTSTASTNDSQPVAASGEVRDTEQPAAKRPKQSDTGTMNRYLVRTTAAEKDNLDQQCARSLFATNSSFLSVEHPEYAKFCKMLRPGYTPPSRHQIGGVLLDKVHAELQESCKEQLANKPVCMAMDGWSNIHNEPIVCVSITDEDGKTYITETIDTSGSAHTAEYLLEESVAAIKRAEENYGCSVKSFVTDNASNMTKMRTELSKSNDLPSPVMAYGCSAHWLNLLSKDLEKTGIKDHVVKVCKHFRNSHHAGAW